MSNDDSSSDIAHKCLRMQLEELETLQAIFCGPGEFQMDNPGISTEFHQYLIGHVENLNLELDYQLQFEVENCPEKIELFCQLPHYYPLVELPQITIRCKNISNSQQNSLKKVIKRAINAVSKPEPFIYELVVWIQDSPIVKGILKEHLVVKEEDNTNNNEVPLERLWIYSHHLKSKKKRKDIVNNANVLDLTGFSLPGKPGIICVEGQKTNTQEFWKLLKQMHWQKIGIKVTESVSETRIFNSFKEELTFVDNDDEVQSLHMSTFIKFLEHHKCDYVKKDLFGFE